MSLTIGLDEHGAVSQAMCVQWSNHGSWSHHVRCLHVYAECRVLKSDDQSFNPAARLSLARCPEFWPVVSLPPQKLGPLHSLLEVPGCREGGGQGNLCSISVQMP